MKGFAASLFRVVSSTEVPTIAAGRVHQLAAKLERKPDAVYKALQRIYATLGDCIRERLGHAENGGVT